MKHIFRTLAAVVVMLTFLFSVSGALPAAHAASSSQTKHPSAVSPSIRVVPCTSRLFVEIDSPANGVTCFRDNGYEGFVRIDDAATLYPGNNNGWIRCYGGICSAFPHGIRLNFQSERPVNLLGTTLITQVAITSQTNPCGKNC